jgi:hypothetical protein
MAGFIYETHTSYEVMWVRQANLINVDGTITPARPVRLRCLRKTTESASRAQDVSLDAFSFELPSGGR